MKITANDRGVSKKTTACFSKMHRWTALLMVLVMFLTTGAFVPGTQSVSAAEKTQEYADNTEPIADILTSEVEPGTVFVQKSISSNVSYDGATDKITVSGNMPEGSYISASCADIADAIMRIGSEAIDNTVRAAYDIKVLYKDTDGNVREYQPEESGNESLKVNITASDIDSSVSSSVYHIEDSGNIEKIDSMSENDTVSFKADSFSEYVISQETALVSSNGVAMTNVCGSFIIFNKKSGYPLRPDNDNPAQTVCQNPYASDTETGQTTVYWSILPYNGYYLIGLGLANTGPQIPTTDYTLDVKNGNVTNGGSLQTYNCNYSDAQLWSIDRNSDGTVTFRSKKDSNEVLDVPGGYTGSTRTPVQTYAYNGSDAQKWILCGYETGGAKGTYFRNSLYLKTLNNGDHFIGNTKNMYYFSASFGGLLAGYRRGGSVDYYQTSPNTAQDSGDGRPGVTAVDDSDEFMCFDFDTLAAVKSDFFYDNRYGTRWASNNNFSDKSTWFYCQASGYCKNQFTHGVSSSQKNGYKYYGTICSGYTPTYTGYKGQVVEASVGAFSSTSTSNYQTLGAALTASSNGSTIYLLRHFTFFGNDYGLSVSKGQNITVDTNVTDGCYIYNTGTAYTVSSYICSFSGGSSSAKLYIDGQGGSGTRGISVSSGGLMTYSYLVIQNQYNSSNGGAIYAASGAGMSLYGGSFTSNRAAYGGGVYAGGSFSIYDSNCSITSNTADYAGGGIYSAYTGSGNYIRGGNITSNSCSYGSAVALAPNVTVNIQGSPTMTGLIEEISSSSLLNFSSSYSGTPLVIQCGNGSYNSLSYTLGRKIATRNSTGYTYGQYDATGTYGESVSTGSSTITPNDATYYSCGFGNGIYLATPVQATFIDYSGSSQSTRYPNGMIGIYSSTLAYIQAPSEHTYSGWTSSGWTESVAPSSSYTVSPSGDIISLSSPKTYYGLYNQNVVLTYDTNGGSYTPSSQSGVRYTNSASIGSTLSPTFNLYGGIAYAGHTFLGWYVSSPVNALKSGGNSFTPATQTAITATAQWNAVAETQYTISYNLAGGTDPGNPTSYSASLLPITLMAPTKAENIFNGWTGSNGGTPQTSVTIPVGTTGNLSYTANWTTITYTITFDPGLHGSFSPESHSGLKKGDDMPLFTGTATPNGSYKLVGWGDSAGGSAIPLPGSVTGNKTYYAIWQYVETFTVSYDPNGHGSFTAETYPGLKAGDDMPKFTGSTTPVGSYKFLGWSESSSGATLEIPGTVTKTVTYYAQWEYAPTYTVIYSPGLHGSFSTQTYTGLTSGDDMPAFSGEKTSKDGWVFTGWALEYTSSTLVTPPKSVSGDVTYYAQWELPVTYIVTYDSGIYGTFMPETYKNLLPGSQTPAFQGTTTGLSGEYFNGWALTNDATEPIKIPNTVTKTVTYYAIWTENPTSHTITFDPNDAQFPDKSNEGRTGDMPDQTVEDDTPTPLAPNQYQHHDDSTFVCWSTTDTLDGGGKTYSDQEEITLTEDTKLYAIWSTKPVDINADTAAGTTRVRFVNDVTLDDTNPLFDYFRVSDDWIGDPSSEKYNALMKALQLANGTDTNDKPAVYKTSSAEVSVMKAYIDAFGAGNLSTDSRQALTYADMTDKFNEYIYKNSNSSNALTAQLISDLRTYMKDKSSDYTGKPDTKSPLSWFADISTDLGWITPQT